MKLRGDACVGDPRIDPSVLWRDGANLRTGRGYLCFAPMWGPIVALAAIVAEIEKRAQGREIGNLQEIRKSLKGLSRIAATSIFAPKTTFGEEYAYHYGGRTELQFNVGVDKPGTFRHGVAFSFEPSQSLPNPEVALLTSVRRFNEFIDLHSAKFSDMSMWEWDRGERRNSDRTITPIRSDLVRRGTFVFMGKIQPIDLIDYELVVDDLDRLLAMYRFVEGRDDFPKLAGNTVDVTFRPGCTVKQRHATASLAERILDIDLRHNELQLLLYSELQQEHGENNVTTEWKTGTGSVDVVVRRENNRYWFYEIKTSLSARACIREGLAQILEYSYWPGTTEPEKLFIVGEPALDREASQYLTMLNERFSLPIGYRQCILPHVSMAS